MATSAGSPTAASPYNGQALELGEIRLLTITWTKDELELHTERHKINENPVFDAISYVWGEAPASRTVLCNGVPSSITPTALEMLRYLYFYRPDPARLIWIDAVCINQNDADEKAVQVPLMHQIYSHACRVIVWAGRSTPETDFLMTELSNIEGSWDYEPAASEIQQRWPTGRGALDPFWAGLTQLVTITWFERLWTFQEVVLAKEAVLLCGRLYLDLIQLLRLASAKCNDPEHYFGKTRSIDIRMMQQWFLIQMQRYRGHITAQGFPAALHTLRRCDVGEEVDRIWALYGLMDGELQSSLTPMIDYSETARSNPWRTVIGCMKIIVIMSRQFDHLLRVPRSDVANRAHLPSWCPDFGKRGEHANIICGTWNNPIRDMVSQYKINLHNDNERDEATASQSRRAVSDHAKKYVHLLEASNLLSICGFEIDRIIEVVEDRSLVGAWDYIEDYTSSVDNHSYTNPKHVAAMQWLSKSLDLARRTTQQSAIMVSHVPWKFLMAFSIDHRVDDISMTALTDAIDVLMAGDYERTFWFDKHRDSAAVRCMSHFRQLVGHSFFSTAQGHFGLATPGCKIGDRVCVFYGGAPLYIVRPHKNDVNLSLTTEGDLWEFVGSAYIPHLMDQHTIDDARHGPDQIFTLA